VRTSGSRAVARLDGVRESDPIAIVALGAVSPARAGARIVVDIRDAGPLDARALRALVLATHAAHAQDGRLVVLCPAGSSRATLRATGLDGHLTVADTRAEAIRAAWPAV
jgi:anti-anti-sigma regulatory factor